MKFYIASKFENKKRIIEISTQLKAAGHEISFDWSNAKTDNLAEAVYDIRGIKNCNAIIGVFEEDYKYKGAIFELGIAFAYYKPIFILGNQLDKMIFMKLPQIHKVHDITDIIEYYREFPH